jgi:hypothetical protein
MPTGASHHGVTGPRRRARRRALGAGRALVLGAVVLGALACSEPPITWRPAAPVAVTPLADDELVVAPGGGVRFAPAGPVRRPSRPDGCPGSVRVARAGTREWYAVWWAPRPDSSAHLLAARSSDGGATWHDPVPVDTLDRHTAGCRRPAPSVAADSASGYVHVAYWLHAPEGPGVFFSHSMDGGALFHAPVPLVYGERPAATSVAAHNDTVVVAYEDPNATPTRVSLALSPSMGHIFEARVPVSGANVAAEAPRVALGGGLVAVGWRERAPAAEESATVVRIGDFRRGRGA